ncbi:hypothetical protein NTE11_003103 [Vibrio fluvialis]|nr:hypothetical protein [Vibrio fluvialis]EKO3461200.1 hypothetical protein [Vibrio fluvialis]MBY8138797.1 hypothetical protein [Vibrio fluvialis]
MKIKTVVLATLIIFSGELLASESNDDDYCLTINSMAGKMMEARQLGIPLAEMKKPLDALSGAEKDLFTDILISAYEKPRFNGEEIKKRYITEHQNEWYLKCIKVYQSK